MQLARFATIPAIEVFHGSICYSISLNELLTFYESYDSAVFAAAFDVLILVAIEIKCIIKPY
jgi:hypothetical protein